MSPAEFSIDPGTLKDALGLAALHVEVWRETYEGIAPARAFEILDEAHRLPYWKSALDPAQQGGVLVVRSGADLFGVASFGPPEAPVMAGAVEIKHFYLRKAARGLGLGRRLFEAAMCEIRKHGPVDVALSVVEENRNSRRIYKRLGGIETESFIDPGPIWRSQNIVVRWRC